MRGSKWTVSGRRAAWLCCALWLAATRAAAAAGASGQGGRGRVVLQWEPVRGVREYELQIAQEASFASPIVIERVSEPGFVWPASPSVPCFWRVRGVDAAGRWGAWSVPSVIQPSYLPPDLLAPKHEQRLFVGADAPAVELRFSEVPGATQYLVEVGFDALFHVRAFRARVWASAYTFKPPSTGSYFWRVRAASTPGARRTTFSETRAFYVLPARPVLGLPTDGAVAAVGASVTLRWSRAAAASSYRIEVARDPAFLEIVWGTTSDETSTQWPAAAAGNFFWRVVSLGERESRAASEVRRLEVRKQDPPPLMDPVRLTARLDVRRGPRAQASPGRPAPPIASSGPRRAGEGAPVLGVGASTALYWNLGAVRTLRVTGMLEYRPAACGGHVSGTVRAGYQQATHSVDSRDGRLSASSLLYALPIDLVISAVLANEVGAVSVGLGGNVTIAHTEVAIDGAVVSQGAAVNIGILAHVGVERGLGPGALFIDSSYVLSTQRQGFAASRQGGLTLEAGYRIWVW